MPNQPHESRPQPQPRALALQRAVALLSCGLVLGVGCGRKDSGQGHNAAAVVVKPRDSAPRPPAPEVANLWQNVRSIELVGTMQSWEPGQSYEAEGPPRDVGSATFTLRDGGASGQASIAWSRHVKYPFARSYDYVSVVNTTRGEVRGLDSQYFETPPPPRAMSTDRLAATWRLIHQLSPLSYLTGRAPELEPVLDPATKLPVRLRAHDADSVQGDSTLDVVMNEWKPEGELLVPRSMSFMLNGQTLAEVTIERVRFNPSDAPAPPPQLSPIKSDANGGPVPYEWVLRREAMGGYSDDDSVSKQHLEQVAEGVFLVAGRTHNALVVDMTDHLVVIDAPLDEAYGQSILRTCHERFPLKPIKTLVLTHHHNDHSGGARAFVAAGVDVLVGSGNFQHFRRMFEAPHHLDHDALDRAPKPAHLTEVSESQTLKSGARSIQLVQVANHHAKGMLVAYLPVERIAFVADLWSPERDKLRAPLTFERHKDLVDALRAAKITPRRIVGGHGGVGNYAELATAVDAGPSE